MKEYQKMGNSEEDAYDNVRDCEVWYVIHVLASMVLSMHSRAG